MLRPLILMALVAVALPAPQAGATVRNYFAPEWNGARLAACMTGEATCGKPVADAFCRAQGYDTSLLFQRETVASTRSIATDQSCEGPGCTAFRQIKCFTAKSDFAGLQQVAE